MRNETMKRRVKEARFLFAYVGYKMYRRNSLRHRPKREIKFVSGKLASGMRKQTYTEKSEVLEK